MLTSILCCLVSSEHPLRFQEELQGKEVEEGDTVLLCCELSKPGVPVEWRKGRVLLRPGGKYEMRQDGCEVQLRIHDVSPQDKGDYTCSAGDVQTTAIVKVKGMTNAVTHNRHFLYASVKCFADHFPGEILQRFLVNSGMYDSQADSHIQGKWFLVHKTTLHCHTMFVFPLVR